MKTRAAAGLLSLAGAFACINAASAAPTAQEILSKSRAAMSGLKTYQATVITSISGGPMSLSMSAKLKTAGGKAWAQLATVPSGGAAQNNPFAAMMQNVVMVDDGKNTYTYIPAMKQYQKGPTGGARQLNVTEQILNKLDSTATLTLAGTESVGGRQAYVVDAKPKKPQPGQEGTIRLDFDQATYHLVQAKVKQSRPARGQSPAQEQTVLVVVRDEKVNQPIPDSLFKFTPPAGAKEAQGGMGFGMPGAPRRPGK